MVQAEVKQGKIGAFVQIVVPVQHEHRYRSLALEFSGCEAAVSDKTIMPMHDWRNAVELKYFMPENSSVTSKPMNNITRNSGAEIVMLEDFDWANPVSIRQVNKNSTFAETKGKVFVTKSEVLRDNSCCLI